MSVKEIQDKNLWNNFVGSQRRSQFLQSWEWGEFQKSIGRSIWRFGIERNGKLAAVCLLVKHDLPMGKSYFYSPRGPVVDQAYGVKEYEELLEKLINKITELANDNNAIFLRIEPPIEKPSEINLAKLGFVAGQTIQPPDTVILNLKKPEDELLSEMHQKTRYNIRLSQKKEVKIIISNEKDFDTFYELIKETSKREKIVCFPKKYYQKMIKAFREENKIKIFSGHCQGKILVSNLIIFFGDMATYNHGGSSNDFRNLMSPHLVQWESILEAKKLGFDYYDLRGIAPTDEPNHKWAGITRFKKGFGGEIIHYIGAYDLIFSSFWYQMYSLAKKIK
jgi:lipid II:glycine glycyltransferase (peptidoglycan interpeptide bridge formation enzyme)